MKSIEINKLVRTNILKMKAYSSARSEYEGLDGIFIDANENPYGVYNRYPDPLQKELKTKIAELKNLKSNQVFIGNGSDEIIDLAIRIFCDPKEDKILLFSPSYGMYSVSANINNVDYISIPLDKNTEIDTALLDPYYTDLNIKLMFICSPNNPTGNSIPRKKLRTIIENFNGIVLIDEAYIDYSDQASAISLLTEYNNIIILQTFSKAWAMASIRVGMAFANKEMIRYLNKVKPPYNISSINQQAILKQLTKKKLIDAQISECKKERNRITSFLNQLQFVKRVFPSDANFILIKVEDANDLYQYLVESKIIIRNRNSQIINCLRISIGSPKQNTALIESLKKYNA
ncbi:UNVERIFIED_CONTAM: hypothetical protein GTU68_045063 [Idotea baltica]|nr:hypothetical protein [Idotea baltica]